VLYHRVPKLFGDLALARGDGRYARIATARSRKSFPPAMENLEMKYALAVALSLLSTAALADPWSQYQLDQANRDFNSQLDQLKQWAVRSALHCGAISGGLGDENRCIDDVEWKFDQRSAEIIRDYNARAAQIIQNSR
jgi:hypothetical protein